MLQGLVNALMMGLHEIGDYNRGRPRPASLTMDKDRSRSVGTAGVVDDVAEVGQLGK